MANIIPSLDRLKAQLLTSGLSEKNQALFQVINQLIDNMRQGMNEVNSNINNLSNSTSNITQLLILQQIISRNNNDSKPSIPFLASISTITSLIVATIFEKAETGNDANVLTYTTGVLDEFLVVQVAFDISALTGTSVAATITWQDSNNNTQTSTVTLTAVADGSINIPINAKASTNVVVSTVFIGVSTAYNISAFITRLK